METLQQKTLTLKTQTCLGATPLWGAILFFPFKKQSYHLSYHILSLSLSLFLIATLLVDNKTSATPLHLI